VGGHRWRRGHARAARRAGTGLVEGLSGARLPAEVTRNLKPLRSAVEYAVSRQHQLSVRFFLWIK
jgi:hypothetical protein